MPAYFNFPENRFFGALVLENIFPSGLRRKIGRALNWALLIFSLPLLYSLLVKLFQNLPSFYGYRLPLAPPSLLGLPFEFWLGILYILLSLRLGLLALQSFFNSKTRNPNGETGAKNLAKMFNLYAAWLWYQIYFSPRADLNGLLRSLGQIKLGQKSLGRLGLTAREYGKILEKSPREVLSLQEFLNYLETKKETGSEIFFSDLVFALFENHRAFREFLIEKGTTPEGAAKAVRWTEREALAENQRKRWWRRENLARIPGIGKDFAYGETYFLERFAYDLVGEASSRKEKLVGRGREVELVEKALLKSSGANVLIVGEPGVGKHTVLLGLVRMISQGKIFPELEHKRVFKLYAESAVASGKDKGEIEAILIRLFNEAVRAGNIIFAIDNFPEFTQSLSTLGINILELLSPYLGSSKLHILALADRTSARRILEPNQALMKFFERIELPEPNLENLMRILEDLAPELERAFSGRALFSYAALQKIAEAATQNLVEGSLPKRAVDLMEEVFKEGAGRHQAIIEPGLALEIVSRKTKMPLGEISEEEKKKLLGLEEILHQRVVDQEEAINSIANAIRRARSGIRNPQKPIGSFMFLGPTGVGKTETAKTLAHIYFGNEEAMLRFDMSEYQSEDSLERLVGSFAKNEPGLLASKILSSPYSVVLLDEFEKSNPKVRNLFLQVLDEGFFTDYLGKRINMRNTIIVATSNAGSEIIWELVKQGLDKTKLQEKIITHIQREKIISPELLNRFDAVIVFRPLGFKVLKKISELALKKLQERLEKQNYLLRINEALIEAVTQGGYNPSLGARPMQRFIQDKIEKLISEKIIRGELKPGAEFSLTPEELAIL
ncbi:hypothetical protein A2757_03650 [Candidatus Giovannonibacteria bacterium RIFCSPHIGHO2_01_FULL_48_47]|nr:MAG: hypothetical protein A2757_03650 [Candidatus Giovannonibacteria bacterium RIFCSPHIGHO2_01_FULL_48_47]OGF68698.1 MAG: hypothetical protein A3D61_01235 [Candidatus Giovannonibacteria bacterium RIFCSPHIGHO2_02_FULL_48_15]OGF89614.1 MAG: hypothetical protein A3B26_02660 [Candidatus Giovannonibacteria bacterium RIFCSPLOWO2_01_FULL_48_47]OGF96369.1 MAG: hypothetical protein A2613_02305 [Candidatus Giovannonibacteria bacterium RIFOXYD1_FULL_48_21]HBT81716.1 hypothetical protein [Candidatus Gio